MRSLLLPGLFGTILLGAAALAAQPTTPPPPPAEQVAWVNQALPQHPSAEPRTPRRLLITARTEGFVHDSIPIGLVALSRLGEHTGAYSPEIDHEMSAFTAENLRRFDAILFLSTTQLAFADPAARTALLDFVNGGGGLIGIHAASDNFPSWPEGQALIGGVFHSHPWFAGDTSAVKLDDPTHPLNAAFHNQGFWIRDEIYQIVGPYSRDHQRVLMSLDMARPQNQRPSAQIVRTDADFPIGWIHTHGKGRIFYSSLGHNAEVFWTPQVLRHWLDGIQFALGDLDASTAPSGSLAPAPTPALAPIHPCTFLETATRHREQAAALTPAALDKIVHLTPDADPSALLPLDSALRSSHPATRTAAIASLHDLATHPNLTDSAANLLAERLGTFGGEAAVPLLSTWSASPHRAAAALSALSRRSGAAADRALVEALTRAPLTQRAAVLDALGRRRLAHADRAIARHIRESDTNIALAALDALGRIATPRALRALERYRPPSPTHAHTALWARIHALHTLLAESRHREASRLLKALRALPEHDLAAHSALQRAWLRLEPSSALPSLLPILSRPALGARLLRPWLEAALASPQPTAWIERLATSQSQLPRDVQLHLPSHCEQLANPTLLPLVLHSLQATDPAQRHAAFAALAAIGSPAQPELLVAALSQPADRETAAEALIAWRSADCEKCLVATLPAASDEVHAALLHILARRNHRPALALMFAAAASDNRALRSAGFRGLATLAIGEDLDAILALRAKLTPADYRLWQGALRTAVRGRDDVEATLQRLQAEVHASSAPLRNAFLHAIVGFETPESSALVTTLLENPDADFRRDLVRVLASARNETSLQLIDVAEEDPDLTLHALALRGYLDTLALRHARWLPTIMGYQRAGVAARRMEEREAAIARLTTGFWGAAFPAQVASELRDLPLAKSRP